MEKFTWNDLVAAINDLPAEQREKQVYFSAEDEPEFRKVDSLGTIPEDVYTNKQDEEDGSDLETLKEIHGKDFKMEDYELTTSKGTPFLWDGF